MVKIDNASEHEGALRTKLLMESDVREATHKLGPIRIKKRQS